MQHAITGKCDVACCDSSTRVRHNESLIPILKPGSKNLLFPHNLQNPINPGSHHSLLKLFTGLANAAFIAWKLTVPSAINTPKPAAITNTVHGISIRYSYC